MDQRVLVERARQGDHDAFAKLVDPSLARLDAAARLILRDAELARDAVQETLIRAWRDLPGLRDPERFDAWIHRLTVNACLDLARRRRRRPIEVELNPIDSPVHRRPCRRAGRPGARGPRPPGPGSRAPRGRRAALPAGDAAARRGGGPRHPPGHGEVPAPSRARVDAPVDRSSPTRPPRQSPEGRSHDRRQPVRAICPRSSRTCTWGRLPTTAPRPWRPRRTRQRPSWTFAGRWLPMADIASRPAFAPRVPLRSIGVALLIIALVVAAAALAIGSRKTKRSAAVRARPQWPARLCRRWRHLPRSIRPRTPRAPS